MDRLVQQLCKELPRAGEAQVRNFVHQAMQHESPPESGHAPFPDTVRALLAAGASAGQVLAALLRCEWVSIRELTKSCQQGKPSGEGFCRNQVSALTACIQHYNDLQAAGIVRWHQCGEDGKRAGIEIRPDAAIRAHFQRMLMREQRTVIGRLRNLGLPAWLQEPEQ